MLDFLAGVVQQDGFATRCTGRFLPGPSAFNIACLKPSGVAVGAALRYNGNLVACACRHRTKSCVGCLAEAGCLSWEDVTLLCLMQGLGQLFDAGCGDRGPRRS